jgi:predicted methyltransferase
MNTMGFTSVLSFAQKLATERIRLGDYVIDATVGGGNDTLFLARSVGDKGCVYGFDIQPEALEQASQKLTAELGTERATVLVQLMLRNHAEMEAAIPEFRHGQAAVVMFNLGYLPSGDHSVITLVDTTLLALEASLRLLRPGGIVTIVVYPGHSGGDAEADAVMKWAACLSQTEYQALIYRFANQRETAPYLIAIEKR